MADQDDVQTALEKCVEELRKQKDRGSLSTAAPDSFKQLADRIEAVIEERRKGERRSTPRAAPDRRKSRGND